jgi:hypothetical protein
VRFGRARSSSLELAGDSPEGRADRGPTEDSILHQLIDLGRSVMSTSFLCGPTFIPAYAGGADQGNRRCSRSPEVYASISARTQPPA